LFIICFWHADPPKKEGKHGAIISVRLEIQVILQVASRLDHQVVNRGTNEYLMSISGTSNYLFGSKTQVVTSICFMTNLKLYGPYGNSYGAPFSHDVKDGVVVGFHGRASDYINAIGVYVMPKSLALDSNSKNKCKTMSELCSSMSRMVMPRDVGPWGAGGGKSWDDGVFSTIKQVLVHVGELNVIYALQFEYQKRDGKSVLSQIHGGADGHEIKVVNLDDKGEFIIGVSGCYGPVEGHKGLEAIVSISFHTNKRIHGPYGEELDAGYFSSTPSPGKVILKFKVEIDVENDTDAFSICRQETNNQHWNGNGGTNHFEGWVTHGPWGGSEGNKWVYLPQGCIEKITVEHGNAVDSIKFHNNCTNGEPSSSFFGRNIFSTWAKLTTISIDCPKEYLMSISGTVGSVGSYDALKSICFMTNLNVYGPYGSDVGTAFSYEVKDEVIVGFHGRASILYLTAIGIYAKPKSPAPRPTYTHEAKIKNEYVYNGIAEGTRPVGSMWSDVSSTTGYFIRESAHVDLDFKDEYLTGVSGFYVLVKGNPSSPMLLDPIDY
ncbi:hypothetical protein M8C21_004794, partial [Ambrosia artemisiifolia]